MRRAPSWPRHAIMVVVSFLMLVPFYWVLKTSLTGENIYGFPPHIVPIVKRGCCVRSRRRIADRCPTVR